MFNNQGSASHWSTVAASRRSGLGEALDGRDRLGTRDGRRDRGLVAPRRDFPASVARQIERMQSVVEFPVVAGPRQPFSPRRYEAEIESVPLGEPERQRFIREFRRPEILVRFSDERFESNELHAALRFSST